MIVKIKDKEYTFDGYAQPLQSIQQLVEECYQQGRADQRKEDEELNYHYQTSHECYMQGRADAIDEFLIDVIYKIEFEEKWLMKAKSDNADTNVMFSSLKTFCKERAEQLKEQN